jgi:hypothetical protein
MDSPSLNRLGAYVKFFYSVNPFSRMALSFMNFAMPVFILRK